MGEHKRKPLTASDGADWPPAVLAAAPPRWSGHIFVGDLALAYFYGDLVAQWLGPRGIYLDTCKIFERYECGERRNFGVRRRRLRRGRGNNVAGRMDGHHERGGGQWNGCQK